MGELRHMQATQRSAIFVRMSLRLCCFPRQLLDMGIPGATVLAYAGYSLLTKVALGLLSHVVITHSFLDGLHPATGAAVSACQCP